MIQSHLLALWPGSGEKSSRFSRDSGIRLCSQRQNMSVGTSKSIATKGLTKMDSHSMGAV